MEIKWINRNNLKSILNEKSIFIYGYGSLAHVTAKWLVKNGVNEFRFCVDREFCQTEFWPLKSVLSR